jgi:alpha-L-fucosidase 2
VSGQKVSNRQSPDLSLWFDAPATKFTQSLPLGNGRLGAMVFGGGVEEKIILNEGTLWSGGPQDADRPDAAKLLPEIRRLLLGGKNAEAEALVYNNFTARGPGSGRGKGKDAAYGAYQTLGSLHLKFDGDERGAELSKGTESRRSRGAGQFSTKRR